MQTAVESETKSKIEALRMKKKLDNDVIDLGVALELPMRRANGRLKCCRTTSA